MRKGYVTVFYAISMALILSLFMGLVEGVARNGSKLKAECAVDTALISEFAEYNSILWKNYGLIFVDCAYKESKGGNDKVQNHLRDCLDKNFDESSLKFLGGVDLYGLKTSECSIDGIRFATDDKGIAIAEQMCQIMKYKYAVGFIKELIVFAQTAEQFSLDPTEYINKAEAANRELVGSYDIHDYQGWVNSVDVGVNESGPLEVSQRSILRKIMSNPDSVSHGIIESEFKNRQINKGNLKTDFTLDGIDKLIVKQYYCDFLSSYQNLIDNVNLAYQKEYLVFGKKSDIQNLELAAKKIMHIRLAADIVSLLSDSQRMDKINSVAKIVASLVGFPEASVLITTVVVAGWSYWESLTDLKYLFAGKKVPFYKSHNEWITGLAGFSGGNDGYSGEKGMSYEDYIRLFIFLSDYEILMERFMEVAESEIRNISGYEVFRIDNCFDYIDTHIEIETKRGYSFDVSRRKGIFHD